MQLQLGTHTQKITTENVIYGLLGLEYPMEQCFHFACMCLFSYMHGFIPLSQNNPLC
jgi:hypothetical protein